MRTGIPNSKHLFAGILFAVIGVFGMSLASQYELGTANRMGPGYFPMAVSGLLAILGAIAIIQSLVRGMSDHVGDMEFLPLVMLSLGIISFALLVERFGLVPAIFSLVILSSYARWRSHPLEILGIAVTLSVVCVVIFVHVVQLGLVAFKW